jgi:hypothetical protein
MKLFLTYVCVATVALFAPRAAHAQSTIFVSPYIGGTFSGGDATKSGAPTVGVSAGWRGAGWWGGEVDVAATPGFFAQDGFRTDRRAATVLGSVLFGTPTHDRPFGGYATAGAGSMMLRLSEPGGLASVDVTQPVVSLGGGLVWLKHGNGIRGDVRYLHALGNEADDTNAFGLELSTQHFVRATIGVIVAF